MIIKIKKGYDIPMTGGIDQKTTFFKKSKRVAVYGPDYRGMKPSMLVEVGQSVAIGEVLFSCKKTEGVKYTSPVSGKVVEINRGQRRAFISIVIEDDGEDRHYSVDEKIHAPLADLNGEAIRELLVATGEWTALRTRPFSKVPAIEDAPHSIFVTAIDTNPLAFDPASIIELHREDFECGLNVLNKLTEGKVHLCSRTQLDFSSVLKVEQHQFIGPHPAGNVGTHIHYIDPVHEQKSVWHIGYQDVIAFGHLFNKKKIWNRRYMGLVGDLVNEPKILEVCRGASLEEICVGELKDYDNARIISGSVLNGYRAFGPSCFLGRYHNQVTVIQEKEERKVLGWAMPGLDKFSLGKSFLSSFIPKKKFNFSCVLNGGHRAIVPIGTFEKVLPFQMLATPLLTSLACKDVDQAIRLGCLELDEEDLSLCTFSCNGKNDYGEYLRECLTIIEKESV